MGHSLAATWLGLLLGVGGRLTPDPIAPLLQPRPDHVRLWADVGSASWTPSRQKYCVHEGKQMECGLSDDEAAFIAKTYDIVSLEKCFGTGGSNVNSTVSNALFTAKQIKRQPGGNETKVLMLWSASSAFADCYEYEYGGNFLDHPEWWLKHTDGTPIVDQQKDRYFIDFTVPEAADWFVKTIVKVHVLADGALDGVFLIGSFDFADHLPKQDLPADRIDEINKAHLHAIRRVARSLRAMSSSAFVIGNNLRADSSSTGLELLQDGTLDGVVAENFGAFEWVDSTGVLKPEVVDSWLDIFQKAAAFKKLVLIKGWVGPERFPGPSWPKSFMDPSTGQPLVMTSDSIAQASAHFLDYSLGAFLCVWEPGFMFSYSWFWDVSQGELPGEDAPRDWYPQFQRPVGKALGPAQLQAAPNGMGKVCKRSFQEADIEVDLLNFNNAHIYWKGASCRRSLGSGLPVLLLLVWAAAWHK